MRSREDQTFVAFKCDSQLYNAQIGRQMTPVCNTESTMNSRSAAHSTPSVSYDESAQISRTSLLSKIPYRFSSSISPPLEELIYLKYLCYFLLSNLSGRKDSMRPQSASTLPCTLPLIPLPGCLAADGQCRNQTGNQQRYRQPLSPALTPEVMTQQ